jgi:hypothetical protein
MNVEDYKNTLLAKTIDELSADMQGIINQIDILFTMNNSLDDVDITEGGGEPHVQAQYQDFLMQQKCIKEEINKRHMLEELK